MLSIYVGFKKRLNILKKSKTDYFKNKFCSVFIVHRNEIRKLMDRKCLERTEEESRVYRIGSAVSRTLIIYKKKLLTN